MKCCRISMIDKFDIRVPGPAPYTPAFFRLYPELRNNPKGPFHASRQYLAVADLRPYGHDVILHTHCKFGKGDHKIELIDTGIRSFEYLLNEVRRIFDVNPSNLELIRVDLATDVPGVPVTWFLSHTRAKFKRFHNAGMGDFEYQQLGQKGIQTLYLGKRPNMFRIYDKVAEWQHQHKKLQRRLGAGVEIPDFHSFYGVWPDTVLTRVERQIGGGRIAQQIKIMGTKETVRVSTVGELRRHAPEFNPFCNLELSQAALPPQPNDFTDINQYMAVMWAREVIPEWGMHAFFQWLNFHTGRNARRWLNRHGPWLPDSVSETASGISSGELYERYRDSVSKQLAA
jgi:hypothetical protein